MFAWDLVFYLFKHIASNERGRDFRQKKKKEFNVLWLFLTQREHLHIFFLFLSFD